MSFHVMNMTKKAEQNQRIMPQLGRFICSGAAVVALLFVTMCPTDTTISVEGLALRRRSMCPLDNVEGRATAHFFAHQIKELKDAEMAQTEVVGSADKASVGDMAGAAEETPVPETNSEWETTGTEAEHAALHQAVKAMRKAAKEAQLSAEKAQWDRELESKLRKDFEDEEGRRQSVMRKAFEKELLFFFEGQSWTSRVWKKYRPDFLKSKDDLRAAVFTAFDTLLKQNNLFSNASEKISYWCVNAVQTWRTARARNKASEGAAKRLLDLLQKLHEACDIQRTVPFLDLVEHPINQKQRAPLTADELDQELQRRLKKIA
jgi:hypothetical protein